MDNQIHSVTVTNMPSDSYRLDQINYNLQSINATLGTLGSSYALNTIANNIGNMVMEIQNLIKHNQALTEKLTTDPLNGIRKSVSDFNLR